LATSYQAFKYMALYSVIQSTSVTILYYHIIEFTNTHYYHIDIGIILPMCATMALSSTYHHLTKYKPTGRLISVQILTSVLGQSVIQAVFQVNNPKLRSYFVKDYHFRTAPKATMVCTI